MCSEGKEGRVEAVFGEGKKGGIEGTKRAGGSIWGRKNGGI